MIIRSKAPLRIGLAGGGTDVSPYSETFGGSILNATLNKYAYATIIPTENQEIVMHAVDKQECQRFSSSSQLPLDDKLILHKGVYNRLVKEFNLEPLSFELYTHVDVPPGSGLGSSSTLVTAIIGAFSEWLKLPLGEYDTAYLAYQVERLDLKLEGGKQDQYAATFGGINFMEFNGDKVIVNPLPVRPHHRQELEFNLLLYYTGTSRLSSSIIRSQSQNIAASDEKALQGMHELKAQSIRMKEAMMRGDLPKIGELLDEGWRSKKLLTEGISNSGLEEIYYVAKNAGAAGGKISGAGGGGFMTFFCPNNTRYKVVEALRKLGGEIHNVKFTRSGLSAWKIK